MNIQRSIVMLSNREPLRHDRDAHGAIRAQRCGGGLVAALEPFIETCQGVWVAHGSGTADRQMVDEHDSVELPVDQPRYRLRRVWLTAEEERRYYDGFANEGLWALCHSVHVAPIFRSSDFCAYRAVNARFAEAACEEAGNGRPLILVHDYHFALAPQLVRRRRPGATIVSFWHIPFPHPRDYAVCPWRRELVEGLLGSTLLGFQTRDDRDNFLAAAERFSDCDVDYTRAVVTHSDGETRVRVYPVSVEWPSRWARLAPPAAECRTSLREELGLRADAIVGLGVDRLDYTKGLEQKFAAIGALLEKRSELRGRLVFVQIAEPSRERLSVYRDLRMRVGNAAARINSQYGAPGYQPIVLRQARHEPADIFRLMRAADFCYVSSLHDGMNLVAKEFVAARDDERGVLVLSEFAGAACELTSAVIVNPFAIDDAGAAIDRAIHMSEREQVRRMRALRSTVARWDSRHWMERMLSDASRPDDQSSSSFTKKAPVAYDPPRARTTMSWRPARSSIGMR